MREAPNDPRRAMILSARVPAPTCCQNRARSLGPRAELRTRANACRGRAPALPDDQHVVAARDQFPNHGRSGQLPGDEQPARGLRVRQQEQVVLAHPASVGARAHPIEVAPTPAGHVPGARRLGGALDERHRPVIDDRGDPAGPGQLIGGYLRTSADQAKSPRVM